MKIIKTGILIISLFFNSSVLANTEQLKEYVDTLMINSFAIINNDKISADEKKGRNSKLMKANLDLIWMANFTLGATRKNLKSQELEQFIEVYTEYVINNYTKIISKYSGQRIVIKEIKSVGDNEYYVEALVVNDKESGSQLDIKFMVRQSSNEGSLIFRVFDIVTEGISLLRTQQQEFSSILQRNNIGYLIRVLKKQAEKFK